LSLTELLQKADDEIGKAASEIEQKVPGGESLAQAETPSFKTLESTEKRRLELNRQRALSFRRLNG